MKLELTHSITHDGLVYSPGVYDESELPVGAAKVFLSYHWAVHPFRTAEESAKKGTVVPAADAQQLKQLNEAAIEQAAVVAQRVAQKAAEKESKEAAEQEAAAERTKKEAATKAAADKAAAEKAAKVAAEKAAAEKAAADKAKAEAEAAKPLNPTA